MLNIILFYFGTKILFIFITLFYCLILS